MLWPPPISSVAADSDPDGKELKTTKVGWAKAATELQKQWRSSLWHFPLQHIYFAHQSSPAHLERWALDVLLVWANEQWTATP